MPGDFKLFPHDWQSAEYVAHWIGHDVTRDDDRRPLLRRMLAASGLPPDAAPEVLDIGAGYGAVSEEILAAFPAARVTLQDYSEPMLAEARRRLAGRAQPLRWAVCDLTDRAWPQRVGGPFDLAVSAIALHNLPSRDDIFACYRAIRGVLRPGGRFLNCDRYPEGVEDHLAALRDAGFSGVECIWRDAPRAILAATRPPG
jgi:ubiquinone/menaquinone biosynthesis C-methylase UbiE